MNTIKKSWLLFVLFCACGDPRIGFNGNSNDPPSTAPLQSSLHLKTRHSVSDLLLQIYGDSTTAAADIESLVRKRVSFFGGPCDLFKQSNFADCAETTGPGTPNSQFAFNTQASTVAPTLSAGRQAYLVRTCHMIHSRDDAVDRAMQLASGKPVPTTNFQQVQSIFMARCTSCHTGAVGQPTNFRNLRTERAWIESGLVVPGNLAASTLYQRISTTNPFLRMPPPASGAALTGGQLALVASWINDLANIPDRSEREDFKAAFELYFPGATAPGAVIDALENVNESTLTTSSYLSDGWRMSLLTLCLSLQYQGN